MKIADLTPEQQQRLEEAMADPIAISFTVEGRNGQILTQRIPLFDYEAGKVEQSSDTKRRTYDVYYPGDGLFTEPLPYSRVFTFTLTTRVRGEQP